MATSKTTPLSDSEALSAAVEVLEHLTRRTDDGEVRDSFILLRMYWRMAAKRASRGKAYERPLRYPVAKTIGTFHVLDEDGRALCLAEDVDRRVDLLVGECCEDCTTVNRQLTKWEREEDDR